MNARRVASVRRLLADLRRSETRGDALRKVRRRAASVVRSRTGRSASDKAATHHRCHGRDQAAGLLVRRRVVATGQGGVRARRPDDPPRWTRPGAQGRQAGRPAAREGGPGRGDRAGRAARAGRDSKRGGPGRRHRMERRLGDRRGRGSPAGWRRGVGDGSCAAPAPSPAVRSGVDEDPRPRRRRPRDVHPGRGGRRGAGRRERRGPPTRPGHRRSRPSPWTPAPWSTSPVGSSPSGSENAPPNWWRSSVGGRPSTSTIAGGVRWPGSSDGSTADRPPSRPASIPVAVMGYQTPDHTLTSGNLGRLHPDPVPARQPRPAQQRDVLRRRRARGAGDGAAGTRPARTSPARRGRARCTWSRSIATSAAPATCPRGPGWSPSADHMHPLYDLRYDFPYHPNIRPLFISFHVNRVEMLSDEAQDYLRRHGPVGCRDWNTVFLLLSAGIDAFFSGCLTTTVDMIFPAREAAYRGKGVGRADRQSAEGRRRRRRNVRQYSHQADEHRSDVADRRPPRRERHPRRLSAGPRSSGHGPTCTPTSRSSPSAFPSTSRPTAPVMLASRA